MSRHIVSLDPIVAKPEIFPQFEAAVDAVVSQQPAHLRSRITAFCSLVSVARAVPEVAQVLGLEGYFDR